LGTEPRWEEVRRLDNDSGPGVPEALPGTFRALARRLEVETVDRVWIFPPLVRGRREWGLVAVSCFTPRDDSAPGSAAIDQDRRRLFTASYSAERTGTGLVVTPVLSEEGAAPLDRLPRVMDGVVRRSGDARGDPREVTIGGDVERFAQLVAELESALPGEAGGTGDP
jgi:hypothetical protein